MVNSSLIKEFRNKVNGNVFFAIHKYKDRGGKNHWNIICSCMDWIDVAIDYIENHEIENENINIKSMQAYTYISAINIIWESVLQLHRVIINRKSIPFKNQNTIFSGNKISKDDNEYFKHIRAIFGAHPVNINDNERKMYASWPTEKIHAEFDFAVRLYSLDVDERDRVFGYTFKELNKFLETRYNYLKVLINELDNQYEQFKNKKIKEKIKKSNNYLEQIKILKKESKKRLNNTYYSNTIKELIVIFETYNNLDKKDEKVITYMNDLKKLVDELYNNLQNMIFKDLQHEDKLKFNYPNEIHYELSKIYECLIDNKYDPMFNYYLDKINDFFQDLIIIEDESNEKILLNIKVGLYYFWKNKNDL